MKRIRVLALVLVFAFAALGGAYAMWYDDLVVDETVTTGVLDLKWGTDPGDLFNPDPGPNYEGYNNNVYGVTESNEGLDELDNGNPNGAWGAKNIGSMTAEVVTRASSGGGDQDKISSMDQLTITLKNGYPGYQERIFAKIENVGTIPAKFKVIPKDIPDWLIVEVWYDGDPNNAKDTGDDYMIWSNKSTSGTLEGLQIDPGETIPVAIYTRVRQSSEAGNEATTTPQNATAKFTLTLKAIQWNEYSADGQYTLPDSIQTMNRIDPHFDGVGYPATQQQ